MPPKKSKKTATTTPKNTDKVGTLWQWYDWNDTKEWIDFAQTDSQLFETKFVAGTEAGTSLKFQLTKELSFNKKHGTKYTFDLGGSKQRTQTNEESGTVRKLRRLVDGQELYKLPADPQKRDRDSDDDNDAKAKPTTGGEDDAEDAKQDGGQDAKGDHDDEKSGSGDDEYEAAPHGLCKIYPPVVGPNEPVRVGPACITPFWSSEKGSAYYTVPAPEVGGVLTDDMIKATEKLLGGKKLPQSYIDLLRSTGQNGGQTNHRHLPIRKKDGSLIKQYHRSEDGGDGYHNFDILFGIGGEDETKGLVSEQSNYLDDQDYPDLGIYFADETEGSANGAWCWDYRKCGPKGEPAVVYVDFEYQDEEDVLHVTNNFQDFLNMLAEPKK